VTDWTLEGRPFGGEGGRPVRRLGEYHLLQKLGQGGMGAVFLAKRLGVGGFEKTFVVKCMLDSLSSSEELITMFFDEARLAARLTHPSIAQIYDFGVIDGTYYIAMEHIAGEDLAAIIAKLRERKVRIPVHIALRILLDVCAGLDYAHTLSEGDTPLGIVHRDVSPSNVMVSYQGSVKLLDFGIAKTTARLTETRSGGFKGKLSYLAPEQIQDRPIDARADLFCLGITMFDLLTLRHPFRRETELGTMHAILHDDLPDPRTLRENVPDGVVAIMNKALARDREERYESAADLAVALQSGLSRIAPGTGVADVARFMVTLFGKDAMARRSHVPTLGEVNLAAVVSPRSSNTIQPVTDDLTDPEEGHEGPTTLEVPVFTPVAPVRTPLPPPVKRLSWGLSATITAGAAVVLVATMLFVRSRRPAPRPALTVVALPVRQPPPPAAPAPTPALPAPTPVPTAAGPEPAPVRAPRRVASVTPPRTNHLDGKILQAVVTRAHPAFSACFTAHSGDLPAVTGQVTVELSVGSTGKVASASAHLPGFSSAALTRCLTDEAEKLRFPKHSDKEIRFAFPLVYRKGK
jgi:serine/threonine protein kinase